MPLTNKILRILSLEDPDLLPVELYKLNLKIIFKHVRTLSELSFELKLHSWDFIISPFYLRGFSINEALDVVKNESADLPFILISDGLGEEIVADMMKAGVEDVVLKSRIERLNHVVKRIIREHEIKEKETKASIIANEAFAAKEQMLAIVSHDIKNPLSAIQLEAQMLQRAATRAENSVLAEEVKIQSNRILKTTDRLKNLISDLLDKNKSENGLAHLCKETIDSARLLQEALDSLRPLIQEKKITLRIFLPHSAFVAIDRNKMFQVFSNLLNNAIKFTPVGGSIQIGMEETQSELVFNFDDSGPGLQDKEINKVFEKYWTGNATDSAGTGLGLFICKTIVEAHGGHIFVENLSEGARFSFTIPKLTSSESFPKPYFENKNDFRKKVFIIDDDDDLREVMSWALGMEGYSVHSYSSPIEALEALNKARFRPDLILVDYHMDEMRGSEFVHKKNEIQNIENCPVLMISASPDEVKNHVPEDFYRKIITKPIDLEGLVDSVRKFLIQ
jgi:signal transduction histidine kinase